MAHSSAEPAFVGAAASGVVAVVGVTMSGEMRAVCEAAQVIVKDEVASLSEATDSLAGFGQCCLPLCLQTAVDYTVALSSDCKVCMAYWTCARGQVTVHFSES